MKFYLISNKKYNIIIIVKMKKKGDFNFDR